MRTLFFAAGFSLLAGLAHANDPIGVWQSQKDDDGDWIDLSIEPCGPQLCGTVAQVYGGNPKVVGMTIIEGMTRVDAQSWSDGRLLDVDADTWYDSRMKLLADDRLEIFGCIGFGLLCESMTLSRLE